MKRLLRGYYDSNYDDSNTLLLEYYGSYMPDKIVYDISAGEDNLVKNGLGAIIHHLLYRLKFAEMIGAVSRVKWGHGMPYYDSQMDDITDNVFEYYFEPISEASEHSIYEFKHILQSDIKHI